MQSGDANQEAQTLMYIDCAAELHNLTFSKYNLKGKVQMNCLAKSLIELAKCFQMRMQIILYRLVGKGCCIVYFCLD